MRTLLCFGDSNTYGQIPGQGIRRLIDSGYLFGGLVY